MKDEIFCKIVTEFDGEPVNHPDQIKKMTFTGQELKEYTEHVLNFFFDGGGEIHINGPGGSMGGKHVVVCGSGPDIMNHTLKAKMIEFSNTGENIAANLKERFKPIFEPKSGQENRRERRKNIKKRK